jgi:predicted  nucleic acid-binding Zn-ribbon protein
MPKSTEVRANIRTHQERVFRKRGFHNIADRSPAQVSQLEGEHSDSRKRLREIQREMKTEQNAEKLAQLKAEYNRLSANQGAVRRALEMASGRR